MHTDPHQTVPGEAGSFLSQPWHRFIGETLLDFRITGILGQGGMGVVFHAHQETLNRKVAIKILQSGVASKESNARLRDEACMIAQLQNPHLVTVHQVGEDKGLVFLVMEFLEGQSLQAMIESARASRSLSKKTLPLSTTLPIIHQIAEALEYAHSKHIVHLDIKPANVMVGQNGHVKVLDFGLAKLMTLSRGFTESGIFGTPFYMSPEQTQGRQLAGGSDQFSLGIVFYEMLTSKCPFQGSTPQAIAQAINTHLPDPPSRLNPQVPPDLDAVIFVMLEKQIQDRYPSMNAFLKDMERLKTMQETAAYKRVSGYQRSMNRRQGTSQVYRLRPRPSGSRRWKRSVLPVMTVLLVLGFGWVFLPWSRLFPVKRSAPAQSVVTRDLQVARNYLLNQRHDLARPLLLKIIEDHGGTVEAEQARTLLSQLDGAD